MDAGDWMVWSTVVVILGTMLVSSPLFGIVDLTPAPEPPPADFGHGSAEVEVESVPTDVTLQRGAFGSGTYHLEGPPGSVTVGAVEGNPYLEYVVKIPALDFVDIHTYPLLGNANEELRLRFRPVEILPRKISRGSYDGTIIVRLQADRFRILYEEPVDIVVEE